MFKAVVLALATIGFMFLGTVAMCYAGFASACVLDLMPAGGDVICTKQTRSAILPLETK